MGKVAKHVEGRSKEARMANRKALGSLSSLTVQPKTKVRYEQARKKFYIFLHDSHLPRGSNSLKRTSGLQMTKPLCCLHPMIFHSVIHVWMCMPVGCNEAAYVVGQLSRHCEKQASMCVTLGQVQATLSTTWPAKFFVFCLRAARKCALRT